MNMTKLPLDVNDNPIPALKLKDDSAHVLDINAATTRNVDPFSQETRVISIYSDVDVYVRFGENDVEATSSDHFFPAHVYYDLSIGGDGVGHSSYMAAIGVSGSGKLYISEKE